MRFRIARLNRWLVTITNVVRLCVVLHSAATLFTFPVVHPRPYGQPGTSAYALAPSVAHRVPRVPLPSGPDALRLS